MELPSFSVVPVRNRDCASELQTGTRSTFPPCQKCCIKGHPLADRAWTDLAGDLSLVQTFTTNEARETLLAALDILCTFHLQRASDFQAPSLHARAMFINSSFVANPRFHLQNAAFFVLEPSHEVLDKPSRSSYMSAFFPEYGGVPLWHWEDADLKDPPAFLSSFAFQSCPPWHRT